MIKDAINNLMLTIVPLVSALITTTSVYYLARLIDYQFATEAAILMFIIALFWNWGKNEMENI